MDLKGFQGITSQAAALELICLLQIQEPLWTNHSIWPLFTSRYSMDKKLSNPIFLIKLISLSLRSFIIGGRRWTIFQHAWSIFQKWCQYFKKICDVFEVLWAFLLKCQKLYLTAVKHFFWNYASIFLWYINILKNNHILLRRMYIFRIWWMIFCIKLNLFRNYLNNYLHYVKILYYTVSLFFFQNLVK